MLHRFVLVFTKMRRQLGYVLSLFFFVAASINVVRWIFKECNCVEFPAHNYVGSWLYNFGTLGFSHMAYLTLKQDFDAKDRARELLSSCINYARYYNPGMDVWKKYRESHVSVLLYMINTFACLSKKIMTHHSYVNNK